LRKQLFTTDNFCPSILCSHGFITLNINHWNIINTQLNTYTMLIILKSSVSYEAGVSIKGCMQYMFTTSHTSANTRTFFVTPNGFGNIRVPRNEGFSYKNRLRLLHMMETHFTKMLTARSFFKFSPSNFACIMINHCCS
jgi:hypothetical protein